MSESYVDFPVFGEGSTKEKPGDPKYNLGFNPGDVLPAEWLNWFLNVMSAGYNQLKSSAENFTPASPNTFTNKTIDGKDNTIYEYKPAIGVPTLWMGTKPDWALDFGNGASTKYLWENYPKLNSAYFKDILDHFKTTGGSGLCADYDATGFYVPDLRGMMPKVVGTSGKSYGHDAIANVGAVLTEKLPNIYGHIYNSYGWTHSDYNDLATWNGGRSGGAIKLGGIEQSNMAWYLTSITGQYTYAGFDFDASKSSSIYSGSHVSPLSFGAMYIVRYE